MRWLLSCLVALLVAPSGSAATSEWTAELSMRYLTVPRTVVSADGALVAFEVREPVMEDETSEYRTQIWVAKSDGSSARQYTFKEQSSTSPVFSPDGAWLAFLRKTSDDDDALAQLHSMRVAGGEAEVLAETEGEITQLAFSPDGKWLAFLMDDAQSEDEKERKKQKRDVQIVGSDYKYGHLYLLPLDGESEQRDVIRLTEGAVDLTEIDWSPDSERLVVRHQPDPRINTAGTAGDLSLVSRATGELAPLVTWPGNDSSPRFSPDGQKIAFVSHGGTVERIGLGDLYLVDVEGGAPQALAHTPDRNASLLGWSADGSELIVAEAYRTTRQLVAVPVGDGAQARFLTDGQGVLGSPSLSTGGTAVAYTWQTTSKPLEVYASDLEQRRLGEKRPLSSLHEGLETPPLAAPSSGPGPPKTASRSKVC